MSETIARYYDESKNPNADSLPGVPLADLSQDQFDAFPTWLQTAIDAWDAYRKTKPRVQITAEATPEKED